MRLSPKLKEWAKLKREWADLVAAESQLRAEGFVETADKIKQEIYELEKILHAE